MTPKIREVIIEFERVQHDLMEYGAKDTEPDLAFHRVITAAIEGKPVDVTRLNWDLYSSVKGWRQATRRLQANAVRVYNAIREQGRLADVQELRNYAWRCN